MKFFLAGIMQGSKLGKGLHSQDYRTFLKQLLEANLDGAEVYDPFAEHHDSITYTDDVGKPVFLRHNYMCREMDVIVAFVPEASMGTAIEMWEGWQHGAVVIAVSPLTTNWAVRFLSHYIYPSLEALESDIRSGQFSIILEKVHENCASPH